MTLKKKKAIAALLKYPTKKEAAQAIGITTRALQNYFEDAEFVQAYKQAFGNMVEDATRQAQQSMQPALDTLKEIVKDKEEAAGARIQASRTILDYALRLTEQFEILERLEKLEREHNNE